MFRVARGRATILCLKTRGAAPGVVSPPRAWGSSLLPTPPRPQSGAEGQNPASKAEEEEEDPWWGLGTKDLGCGDFHPPRPQARLRPMHSFINLIIHKASQVFKKQTKLLLAVPHFRVQVLQWAGERWSGEGRGGSTLPGDSATPTTAARGRHLESQGLINTRAPRRASRGSNRLRGRG